MQKDEAFLSLLGLEIENHKRRQAFFSVFAI